MSTDEFLRIGSAARLLAFHLGQRFGSTGLPHVETARDKLLGAAKSGDVSIVAGPKSWSGAASFPLPAECAQGLTAANIDWDNSVFDASADVPFEATAAVQQLHSGPSTLWVPMGDFTRVFAIDAETVKRWDKR